LRLGFWGGSVFFALKPSLVFIVIKTNLIPTTVKKHTAKRVAVNKKPKNALVTVFINNSPWKEYISKKLRFGESICR
jgi:hypothetical protein